MTHVTECSPSKLSGGGKLGGVVDTAVSCTVIQRDLNRVEKWAEREPTKLKKGKCRLLNMGRNNSIHQSVLSLETSLAEKDPGVLVDTKLSMRQQRRPDASSVFPARLRMVTLHQ